MPFINLGLVPEFASSRLLPQRIGQAKAAAMLLLGDPMLAPEAVTCGLANAALPAAEVLSAAQHAAARLAALPPGAVRESKRLLRGAEAEVLNATIKAEARIFGERLHSPEAREAMQAFFDKRKPDFSRF
jgi:enoyl-CoA hydratase/carnithine racemase